MCTYAFFLVLALPWALMRSKKRAIPFGDALLWCSGMVILFTIAIAALYAAMSRGNSNYQWVFLIAVVLIGIAFNRDSKRAKTPTKGVQYKSSSSHEKKEWQYGPGDFVRTKVAGVSFNNRQQIIDKIEEGDSIWISRDKVNPHDANACAVTWNNEPIGYLPHELAETVSQWLDTAYMYDISGKITNIYKSSNLPTGIEISFHIPTFEEIMYRSEQGDRLYGPPF